jgi:hypothetical protein
MAAVACADVTTPALSVPFDGSLQPEISASLVTAGAAQPASIQATVTLRNPDSRPRTLTRTTTCLVSLRLYADPMRTSAPLYQEEFQTGGCKGTLVVDTLAPGASKTYGGSTRPLSSLHNPTSPSLPPGRYYASVLVGIVELLPMNALLPLGEVVLPP